MAIDDTLPPGELTKLLDNWGKGGTEEERLFDVLQVKLEKRAAILLTLPRNHDVARKITPQELVNIVYLRLRATSDRQGGLNIKDRHHFLGKATVAMHNALQDIVKKGGQSKPKSDLFVPLTSEIVADKPEQSAALMDLRRVLDELRSVNPRQAQAIELHILLGFTLSESAELMGLGTATLKRDLKFALEWLKDELNSLGGPASD